jgi:hypothetical protein
MKTIIERTALLGLAAVILMTGCKSVQTKTDTSCEITTQSSVSDPSETKTSEPESSETETSETKAPAMVRLDLTEEEILDMSDEKLTEYGLLLIEYRIEDVQTPNPQRKEFGFTREEGYQYPGMPAKKSASDYDEALSIATEEWQDDSDNKYTDIGFLGGNDKFWLFKCTNYWRGEFNMIDTKAVYKKDYFDEETSTAFFELNDENIRTFFAYRSHDPIDQSETCIGEFVIKTDEGYVFRKYYMYICYGDYGVNDVVHLLRQEWMISNDGKVEMNRNSDFKERTLELPISSIGEY